MNLPELSIEKFTLPNGLQCVLHLDRKLPVVHVNQWYHVGSKNERPGRTGFAHLFEHIMFQGSKHAPGDYFRFIERAGANLREGGVNGTTDFDRTNYFATVPSGNLEYVLWVESDRLATLAEAFTQADLDNQRDVVRNERRQSLENVPYGKAFMILTENLHPHGHPYSWDVIGSHEDLVAASLDDVREFFRTFYVPGNLTLVIAGDFDPVQARGLVEKYYGDIAPGQPLQRPRRWVPELRGEKIIDVADRVPQERLYLAWPAPPFFDRDEADLDLSARVLADGLSSRLNRSLVYDRELCTNVGAFHHALEISGSFIIVATARPGSDLAQISSIIDREITRLATEGPDPAELERARTKWEYEFISGLERIGGFGGKADRIGAYNTYLGRPDGFAEDLQRYRGVTSDSMKSAVARWIANDNRLSIRYRPEVSERAPVTLDRATSPSLGADRTFLAPKVEQSRLENGLEVFVVERRDLPKVAASFVVRGGVIDDPADLEGLATMTIRTIDLGAAGRSALEIEDRLGDLGTGLSGNAMRESMTLSLDVLSRNLAPALEILADVVIRPDFPQSEVDREKNRQIDTLMQQMNDPSAVAARVRSIVGFGRNHPYGKPSVGTFESIPRMTSSDLQMFHARSFTPERAALVFAGDIDLDEAVQLARRNFGAWTSRGSDPTAIPAVSHPRGGRMYLVDRPGTPQTVVAQILPGPRRSIPDHSAFRLLDAVWGGGGFGTRLNLNLREDKGYTYGVFSNAAMFRDGGLWWAQAAVQTDKTAESILELMKELRALAGERSVTEEELQSARETRVRGFSQGFESLGRIASQVAELFILELPMSELQSEFDRTSATSLPQVLDAARKYVDPSAADLLLVGDAGLIAEPLRKIGFDPILVDENGAELRQASHAAGFQK